MDEYVTLRLISRPEEPADAFRRRLIDFWSHLLRRRPDDYAGVLAEAARAEATPEGHAREYLVSIAAVDVVVAELAAAGIDHAEVDRDEVFTKFEATPPDWFQIPH